MTDEQAEAAVLEAVREYAADLEATFAASSFLAWLRDAHPELLDQVEPERLAALALELIPRVRLTG